MLIEINLLPEKETKKKSLLVLVIISIGILLIGGSALFFLNKTYNNKIERLQGQIATTEELVAIQQQKMLTYESSDSLAQLEKTVEWANQYPIKTVPIIKKLTELLPQRGFIRTFNYDESATVTFTVQFETSREAAYYLNHLQSSPWIETAVLKSVNAETQFFDRQIGQDESDETKLKNEKYVPRYVADFEVTLNKNVIKEEENDPQFSEKKGDED